MTTEQGNEPARQCWVHRERLRGVLGGWLMQYQVRQGDELQHCASIMRIGQTHLSTRSSQSSIDR